MKSIFTFLFLLSFKCLLAQTVVYADEKYGFNPNNSHTYFYNAINGEKGTGNTLVFRDMGSPWYLVYNNNKKRLFDVSNMTIIFEPGCVVEAKQGTWDSNQILFDVLRAKNLNIIGYGATFKMHKSDFPEGEKGHSISIEIAENLSIKGLTLDGSGGDGIYVRKWKNSLIEDVDATGHKRQGISIIECDQLEVRNSKFRNTSGAKPSAGLDIEPDKTDQNIIGCKFYNCSFTGNDSEGIAVALTFTDNRNAPVDILFDNCYTSNNNIAPPYDRGAIGSSVSGYPRDKQVVNDDWVYTAPIEGLVTFKRIAVDGDPRGLYFSRKQYSGYKMVMDNVVGVNLSANENYPLIGFVRKTYDADLGNGGVDFNNVLVHTTKDVSPFGVFDWGAEKKKDGTPYTGSYLGLRDVGGKITVVEPHGNSPKYHNYNPSNNVNVTYSYSNQTSLPSTVVNISATTNKASKTGQVGKATITRSSSRIDYPLFVKYKVESPLVAQGDDISYLTGAVVIEAGKTSAEIDIVARDNGEVEADRPVTLTIENRPLYTIGGNASTQIMVVDDIINPVESGIWLEAECGIVGSNWSIVDDASASGGKYLLPPSGNYYNSPSTDAESIITFNFNATAGVYKIHGRVKALGDSNDSFWVRVNSGSWVKWNLIEHSTNFIWDEVHNQVGSGTPDSITFNLVDGANTVEFANREENTFLDKLFITKTNSNPSGIGETGTNCTINDITAPTVTSISVTDVTVSSFKVDWSLDEGATGRVEWGLTSSLGNQTTLEVGYLSRHIQSVQGLEDGTEYFYRVIGEDESGNAFVGDTYSVTTIDATAPTVTSISVTDVTASSFKVDWSLDEGATGRVEWGLTSSLGNQTTLEVGYLSRHIQSVKGLVGGTTYFYRVIGEDELGNAFVGTIYSVTTLGSATSTALKAKILNNGNIKSEDAVYRLYPNPTTDAITIRGFEGKKEIYITDFSGKMLYNEITELPNPVLNLSEYAPGSYYISVLVNGNKKVFTVIKK